MISAHTPNGRASDPAVAPMKREELTPLTLVGTPITERPPVNNVSSGFARSATCALFV
jgi:hypothetical protein